MLIEDIYDKVYVAMAEETAEDDTVMSEKIHAFIGEVKLEDLTQEKLETFLCHAGVIGQRQGFIKGFHIFARLLVECLA